MMKDIQTGDNLIDVRHVTKTFGKITAVDDLSLEVPHGICFGLLGPNGAGKTTLIEIIEDILTPTAGEVFYKGVQRTADFREQIGIMFQQTALLSYMTIDETLRTFQALYSNSADIQELMDLCHLHEIRNQMNDKISGGQRQRLLLALALVNQPELLFLDEPSTGLDPQARRNLWEIVQTVKQQGRTIILTTHYMEEAQQLCDIVAIMDRGKIIAQGSPSRLIAQYGGGLNLILPATAIPANGHSMPYPVTYNDGKAILRVDDDMNTAIKRLLGLGFDLSKLEVLGPNLEAVFLNLTGRRLRE
jgi:ABC-2 type transport system ATP-binding protein